MELLPDEMIHLIFDNIKVTNDKRKFLRTCNRYYDVTKTLMNNIKYEIFIIRYDYGGWYTFNSKAVFYNLDTCRIYIKKILLKKPITRPINNEMNNKNNYTLLTTRSNCKHDHYYSCKGFIIEEINKCDDIYSYNKII